MNVKFCAFYLFGEGETALEARAIKIGVRSALNSPTPIPEPVCVVANRRRAPRSLRARLMRRIKSAYGIRRPRCRFVSEKWLFTMFKQISASARRCSADACLSIFLHLLTDLDLANAHRKSAFSYTNCPIFWWLLSIVIMGCLQKTVFRNEDHPFLVFFKYVCAQA